MNIKKSKFIENYATIESLCGGVPVYSFNNIAYIHGEGPDFNPGAVMQDGNDNPITKLKLKKSWEIKHNFAGSEHGMTPRTAFNETQPMLPLHLIDGNPDTVWSSWGCYAPDARDEWIRIDLPVESLISEVALVCNQNYPRKSTSDWPDESFWSFGKALPKELEIQVSRDARHWKTVYHNGSVDTDAVRVGVKLPEPAAAKQILITGRHLVRKIFAAEYIFSVGGVEILDPDGDNLALISRGAGISVSSTSYGMFGDKYTQDSLWGPLQYDLGNKWVRAGGDNGSYMWAFTEHDKGKLMVDDAFDNAVTECVENGIKVILNLDFFGNWIYADPPRKTDWRKARYTEVNDSYNDYPPEVNATSEIFAAYLRYVAFIVEKFKDRVELFELGNEWNMRGYCVEWYINKFFKPVYKAIRNANSKVKICLGSTAEYFPAYRLVNCMGSGAYMKDNILMTPGRTMITLNNLNEKDICISVEAKGEAQTGLALRCKNEHYYLAAMYDQQKGIIYFDEVTKGTGFALTEFKALSYAETGTMGETVKLMASVSGNKAVMTVSDGQKTVTLSHDVKDIHDAGSAGIIHAPCRPQPFTLVGEFRNISIGAGFINSLDWSIYWNYWGDGSGENIAPLLDGVAWHPANDDGNWNAEGTAMDNAYFDRVRAFKKDCESMGYKGGYYASELYAGAIYPAVGGFYEGKTDFMMAKYLLRALVGHSSLDTMSGPCHPHFNSYPHPQALCRVPAPVQTVSPCQPTPSYYAWRNAATALEDLYEADFPVTFSDGRDIVSFPLKNSDGTRFALALWIDVPLADSFSEKTVDIVLDVIAVERVLAVDLFNGTEQELLLDGKTLKNIKVKDYPIVIYLDLK